VDHHFQVNLRGIIDLLANHLYSGPEVFVRELLQNAVDAIHAREKLQPDFRGEISLELVASRGGKPATLVVSENGIGLTEEEIHRFLATIGESSKRGLAGERLADFIGQFGIGLLSCFMVSEEIVAVTRSATGNTPTMEWRGRADGTYTVKKLDADIAPGTQVYLTCKEGCEEFFERDRLEELARHYGGLLPYPIRITAGKSSRVINADPPPWRQSYSSPRERTKALLAYGRELFQERFFDAIPLHADAGGIDGVAFILNTAPSATAKRLHRIYLKNMFLTERADNLLPPWAFFAKLVVNVTGLKPTASREGFQEDRLLRASRDALGACLRRYLIELSEHEPDKLTKLIAIHHLTIKALAVADDDFYRIVFDWLPVETSAGDMTLGEYRSQHDVLRYAPTMDQFRQIARVAAAQGICVINATYVYVNELLEKCPLVFEDARVERIEARDVTENFADLDETAEKQAEAFVRTADAVLRPFRCYAEMKKFSPAELPTLYTTSSEGQFLRSVEQSRDVASPLWSSVLDNVAPQAAGGGAPFAQLCFNFDNSLIRRLLEVDSREVLRRAIQMLYVQSLLLGHHPLSSKEMSLLNDGLLGLIELSLNANEPRSNSGRS
jgi:molecular chaperone HtpG